METRDDRLRRFGLIAGGIVALGLLIWLLLWISFNGLWPEVRDITVVVLAVITMVPLLALAYAVLELTRTARTIKNELLPVLDELKETTQSVRQTAKIATDFTVKPAVRTAGLVVGFSQAASVILGQGNARQRREERQRRAAEAAAQNEEAADADR
jgi:hypothetical protein